MPENRRMRSALLALAMLLLPASIAAATEPQWQPITITGRVVDTNGQPIKGAMCLWDWSGWREPTRELLTEATTDANGRFELTEIDSVASDVRYRASGHLWFLADGHAVHWQQYEQLPPISSHRRTLDIVLKPARPFSYRVLDPDGRPRVGELIEPFRIQSTRMILQPSRPIRDRLSGTTDEAGLFVVNFLSQDQGMMVRVMSERFGTLHQASNLTVMPPIVTLQLRRVGGVEGVIKTDRPERFAGRRIHVNSYWEQPETETALFGQAETTLDSNGRFQVPVIPEGNLRVYMDAVPGEELVTSPSPETVEAKPGTLTKVSVSLSKRIPVTGRVRMADGTVPSGDATVIVPETGISSEYRGRMTGNGSFRICVDPGEFKLRVEMQTLDGLPVAYRTLFAETVVTVNKETPHLECPDLVLPKTHMVEGLALAADGQPLVGAKFYAKFGKESGVTIKTDAAGRFHYVVAEETPPGVYIMYLGDARTSVTLEKTDDPLTIRIPASPDDTTGH